MKYITISPSTTDCRYLLPLSDLHIGDPHFNESKFLQLRDWIAGQDKTDVILVGDILNCATKASKSDIYGERLNPQEAKRKAVEILEPIRHKIKGMVWGNHERRVYRESGIDVCEDVADRLGVEYAREGIVLVHKFKPYETKGNICYVTYATHGFGGGRTKGSKTNVVDKLSSIVQADIYICGHTHFATAFKDSFFIPDLRANRIQRVTRTYVSAGSFLDYGGYSEDMGLPPAKLGTPRIRLDGRKKNCHVSI
jgi:predicted phosphodiesterase